MSSSFAARADAIFGTLGATGKQDQWSLDTAQGFRPGANDALDRDSSGDEAEEPEPQFLSGADDSDAEQEYRLKASKCYRQAFEREEEEDEYDRVAAGHTAEESRPLRSMEVLEDNAFDRMHSLSHCAAVSRAAAAQLADHLTVVAHQQQPMELDDSPPALEAPATLQQDKQLRQQSNQDSKRHKSSQQVRATPHRRPDMPHTETEDMQQINSNRNAQQPDQCQQQHTARRVRFAAGHTSQSDADSHQPPQRQQQQRHQAWVPTGRGGRVPGRGGGARGRGGSFVPDHVRNPQRYTVYTLDEPIYVGQGHKEPEQLQETQHEQRQRQRAGDSSGSDGSHRHSIRLHGSVPVDMEHDVEARGRWQDGEDASTILTDGGLDHGAGDYLDRHHDAADVNPVTHNQLPPAGSIKFQPSSKRSKTRAHDDGVAGTLSDQPTHRSRGPSADPLPAPVPAHKVILDDDVYMQEHLQDADAEPLAAATSTTVRSKGPSDKPILCNACGARYLAKNKQAIALEGWMPGCRGQHVQPGLTSTRHENGSVKRYITSQAVVGSSRDMGYSKRLWHNVQVDSSGASSTSKDTAVDTGAECSSKRARLLSSHIYEIDPHTASALRLLQTFETADGVVLTVIRRPRKQAKPQPCAVM